MNHFLNPSGLLWKLERLADLVVDAFGASRLAHMRNRNPKAPARDAGGILGHIRSGGYRHFAALDGLDKFRGAVALNPLGGLN